MGEHLQSTYCSEDTGLSMKVKDEVSHSLGSCDLYSSQHKFEVGIKEKFRLAICQLRSPPLTTHRITRPAVPVGTVPHSLLVIL
ncbi:hypothetical protein UY3_07352 [Chelonia mydas]|uniref:Uncharacterized protein n=1 Tax=Chelonia mydas TaxID=8469 RepID=M7BDZ8_CHEMY|nr:hypothetical protein UY3_07352 [Chelonia mydas]